MTPTDPTPTFSSWGEPTRSSVLSFPAVARPAAAGRVVRSPERVLFVSKSMSRSRCSSALIDALERNGLIVRWFNHARNRRWLGTAGAARRARRMFAEFRPDLLFVFCRDLPLPLIDEFRRNVPLVLWMEELQGQVSDTQLAYLQRADLVSMSDPSRFGELRDLGVTGLIHQMSGFSPRYHRPLVGRRERWGVSFIGTPGHRGQRAEFLARVADEIEVDVFGPGWSEFRNLHPGLRVHRPVNNRGYQRICAGSKIVLGLNESNSTPGYFSNRTWLTLGCGAFHLTHHVPGLEGVFERGLHLDWFESPEEARRLIAYYLERPGERAQIAAEGHAFACAHHQYAHRIRGILDRISGSSLRREPVLIPLPAAAEATKADADRLAL